MEIKNQSESVIFTMEKMLKESGDKMKPEEKKEMEEKTAELKKAQEGGNVEEMKKKMEELNTIAQKIGAAMYQQADADAKAAEQSGDKKTEEGKGAAEEKKENEDEVVEGEVEENK